MVASPSVYEAIGEPTRRAVLDALRGGERSVGELFELTAAGRMTQPAFSQHVRKLREAGLIRQERRGRERWCSLDAQGLKYVSDWVRAFEKFWDAKLDALGAFLDSSAKGGGDGG